MKSGLKKIIILSIGIIASYSFKATTWNMEATPQGLKEGLALRYLIQEPQTPSLKKKAIILLHGVGSNEEDLFSLANQLPKEYYIIAARGNLTLSPGSYAWYHVDFSTGKPVYNMEEEAQSRKLILQFMEQLKKQYQLDEVILGGFSQGAIMSWSVGLTHPEKVKGIFCLSGRILQEIRGEVKQNKDLQQLRIFLAHGTQDGTLSITYARETKTYLEQLQLTPSYHEYTMGHQINPEELKALNDWLLH